MKVINKRNYGMSEEEGLKYYSELYPDEEIRYNKEYEVFVSDQGNVFSKCKAKGKHMKNESIHGYSSFRNTTVHKLVMLTFGKYVEGLEIDHINNKRNDNRLCNLRMITHAENMRKRDLENGPPMSGKYGKDHPRSIPVIQCDMDGNFINEYESCNLAAKYLNLSQPAITACCKNKRGHNSCGGYKWKYKTQK